METGGGRDPRQPGQVRKEAAATRFSRVVVQSPLALRSGNLHFHDMSESDPDTDNLQPDPIDPDQGSMFDDSAMPSAPPAYQVLARKYRPDNFDDLIGQQTMVHTLTNAFAAGRIAHAFMLTGVRGVGKTTTARLLARALNYQSDEIDAPSMQLSPSGIHCAEISASRHMDVMEMDAASHTGIGDIREILDSVRYAPVSARYKVYIIDEVHMLSKPAFNALLKTLEEPPPHAIFILATTEIRKVPVTILSRCQRFDLSRVDTETMVEHLQRICKTENRKVSREGLVLIARASEGSVRDALSILDQALVQADGTEEVDAENIRIMLGLADRGRILQLLALALRADISAVLTELREQYDLGADPVVIVSDLLDHCHQVTRAKALGEAADLSQYGSGAQLVRTLADEFSMGQLSRSWQILLKAANEIRIASDSLAATEMALIRLCVAMNLPGPEHSARLLLGQTDTPANSREKPAVGTQTQTQAHKSVPGTQNLMTNPRPQPQTSDYSAKPPSTNTSSAAQPARIESAAEPVSATVLTPDAPQSFEQLLQYLEENRELHLLNQLEQYVRLISYQPGAISFSAEDGAPPNLAAELSRQLQQITGQRWLLDQEHTAKGKVTVANARREAKQREHTKIMSDMEVQTVLQAFPEAKIIGLVEPDPDGEFE